MSVLEAIVLGLLQGLTEFLPVSSSGHLALGQALLGASGEEDLRFNILVHGATALSTVWVFRKDIGQLISGGWSNGTLQPLAEDGAEIPARKFIGWLVLSAIPAAGVGLGLRDWFEIHFVGQPARVGMMLMVTGVWLLAAQRFARNGKALGMGGAIAMGIAQAVAILPGISRSGATIGMGLLSGVPRAEAARFSFLMALPPILGAMLLETRDLLDAAPASAGTETPVLVYAAGFLTAFFTGTLACQWMIQLVRKLNLGYFAFYCLAAGWVAVLFLG